MVQTFYFYDLETSGFNPREARVMQFAGQRTDLKMKPIGEPHNILIKMNNDILPEPDAVLVTGITPQKTISDGISEVEFLKIFQSEVATPGTIFVGFNTIRFDDEFMRFMHYRNFYDPYEWEWREGRSRWDLLDVVRMTRALRPEGINWPFAPDGKPSNRLELLTELNGIAHANAHDALADVTASIALARLVYNKQPKLFNYLLEMRNKKNVAALVLQDKPFIYTSGKYNSDYEKTTVVGLLAEHPSQQGGALVFDLRYDPSAFADLSPEELAEAMRRRSDQEGPRLPLKTLKYNRCPAIAPLLVLDDVSRDRLELVQSEYLKNFRTLKQLQDQLEVKIKLAIELLDKRQQTKLLEDETEVDGRLYEGFFSEGDQTKMSLIRASQSQDISNEDIVFHDGRLQSLLPLYKARNYQSALSEEEAMQWEQYRERKLLGGGATSRASRYFARLAELAKQPDISPKQTYLLEELQLYGESILPFNE